jgi:hypothetical protein
MIAKANEYIMTCFILYDMTLYTYSTIALASLLVVLEEWNFSKYQVSILSMIDEQEIPFDLVAAM